MTPPALAAADLLPGESVTDSFTITNSGTVDLAVTPTVASTSGLFTLRISIQAAGVDPNGQCPAPTAFLADPAVGTPSDPPIPAVTIAAGQSRLVCATVSASSALLPSTPSFPYAVTFTGAQS